MTTARDKWEAFLDPDVLKGKLISGSIYVAAYEMIKRRWRADDEEKT